MTIVARWNGATIARSDKTVIVEGNHYFPLDDVDRNALEHSQATSHCPWKGDASYYNIRSGGELNRDAAWYYPQPKDKAAQIKDHVAFWNGVEVAEE